LKNHDQEHVVKVKILDQYYRIVSDDAERVCRIVDYLNEQTEVIKNSSPVLNRFDLSVMTAFRAATDLWQAREDLERLRRKIEVEAQALADRIESSLPEP